MSDIKETIGRGIELCRQGLWLQGMFCLYSVSRTRNRTLTYPGLFYSYFGYGIAFCESRTKEGLALCERAIDVQCHEAENYYNLARVHLLREDRPAALQIVYRGLKVDPEHVGLHALRQEMGIRRKPVLSFLHRNHLLNRFLGKLRCRLQAP